MSKPPRERPRFPAVTPTRFGHPNEGVHNRIGYRVMEQAFLYSAEKYASGRLVDIGCGSKPWKALFAPYVDEHIGVDRCRERAQAGRGGRRRDRLRRAPSRRVRRHDPLLLGDRAPGGSAPRDGDVQPPAGAGRVPDHDRAVLLADPRGALRLLPLLPVRASRARRARSELELVELVPLSGAWTTFALELSYALRGYRKGAMTPVRGRLHARHAVVRRALGPRRLPAEVQLEPPCDRASARRRRAVRRSARGTILNPIDGPHVGGDDRDPHRERRGHRHPGVDGERGEPEPEREQVGAADPPPVPRHRVDAHADERDGQREARRTRSRSPRRRRRTSTAG